MRHITYVDLEVVHQGRVLANEEELESIFTSPEQPLIIFVPTELAMVEYKNLMTVCLRDIDRYKRNQINLMSTSLSLQYKLEKIIFDFSLPMLDSQDLRNAIPQKFRKTCEEHLKLMLLRGEEVTKEEVLRRMNELARTDEVCIIDDDDIAEVEP